MLNIINQTINIYKDISFISSTNICMIDGIKKAGNLLPPAL